MMASNTKVISSTTLSHHYRLIHVWNLSLNDRFIKYYWNEHFTLCLICNSSACSSVHTKYHISFHATWASCLWTCLNKLYRGERSYKLLFFGAANTHFSPASSCFLIFFYYFFMSCLALLHCSTLNSSVLSRTSSYACCCCFPQMYFMHAYIWDSCFCSFASCLYKSMKRIKHEPGKRLWIVRLFCHTHNKDTLLP